MKELFGFQIPEPLFWVIVAVVIIAVIAAIAIPIYKGYKAELERQAKLEAKKKAAAKKKSAAKKSTR